MFPDFFFDLITSTIELAGGGLSSLSTDFAEPEPPVTGVLPTLLEGVVLTETLPEGLD